MMSDSEQNKDRKIIIDEDWKSQVEQEREQLKETPPHAASDGPQNDPQDPGQLPPASFDLLLSSLATQTLACLGQIPDPLDGKPVVRLDLAHHHIDLLAMLEEKTKGNLTSDEKETLSHLVHELRMMYVAIEKQNAP